MKRRDKRLETRTPISSVENSYETESGKNQAGIKLLTGWLID